MLFSFTFLVFGLFILKQGVNMRTSRQLSDETKKKISASMKNRSKSQTHKANISKGMKTYWEGIPDKEDTDFTSTGRIV